jgi:hypothetical protein
MGGNVMANRLDQLRQKFSTKPARKPRRSRSEATAQKTAQKAARRVETMRKARAMIAHINSLPAMDDDLRRLKDRLIEELFGLTHSRRAFKGLPVPRLH